MKNYRPDGWDANSIAKPIKATEPSGKWVSQLDVELVEAGADAMLEAIWKMAEESPTGTFIFDTHVINIFERR